MSYGLTDAQESFMNDLHLTNTDARALAVVEAALKLRNTMPRTTVFRPEEVRREFIETIDKAAG